MQEPLLENTKASVVNRHSNKFIDLTGRRFGALLVLSRALEDEKEKGRGARWDCICDCGKLHVAPGTVLRDGRSKSCGCTKDARITVARTKHGASSGGARTLEYQIWMAMRQRCNNKDCKSYVNYGGRGITVCARWDSYENFLEDMGAKPGHRRSIERVDNSKGYSPSNCRWATDSEQSHNKRNNRWLLHGGIRDTITGWAKRIGITTSTLRFRLANWEYDDAFQPK